MHGVRVDDGGEILVVLRGLALVAARGVVGVNYGTATSFISGMVEMMGWSLEISAGVKRGCGWTFCGGVTFVGW